MIILTLFAFLAGVVTVLSPCILPVLPIVLSSSVNQDKKRPYGVIIGFVLSFTFFTLFLSSLVKATGVSADVLRSASIVIIAFFGLSLLWPKMRLWLEKSFQRLTQFAPQTKKQGMFGGVLVGFSLGLLWTPCVGPILASVISLALTGNVSISAFVITAAYAIGTAIPMLMIMKGGQALLQRHSWLTSNTNKIQQAFGVVMILTAISIGFNWDRQFQTWVLAKFPQYGVGLTKIEEVKVVQDRLDNLQTKTGQSRDDKEDEMGRPIFKVRGDESGQLPIIFKAPAIQPSGEWFNSEPLTLEELAQQEKVVLIDFWTYSCINCIRTLPYLRGWHDKYADKGLVIIGVHSPEFEFEKKASNVLDAIDDFELKYPVVQDNDFLTWRAYNNRYWPAKYLIDKEGQVRYTHFGEGSYTETENAIRLLLEEEPLQDSKLSQPTRRRQSPEIYLGYQRAKNYTQPSLKLDQEQTLELSGSLPQDGVGLNGKWYLDAEFVEARVNKAQLQLDFMGQQVYLVMETAPGIESAQVKVLVDGQSLPASYLTNDTNQQGVITVKEARKYDLLDLGDDYGRHTLTLEFDQGVRVFAFTFGS